MTALIDNLVWEQQHGSGLQREMGYRLVEWAEDYAVLELVIAPRHLNRSGILHGGVIATLLDTVSGYACCYCPVQGHLRRSLTLSLTTNFMGQATSGVVRSIARRQGGGRKIAFTTATAMNEDGEIIASATGTFRLHRGSEDPRGIARPAD
ncbi:MAG: PaaI family thioesterase [Pseudomonadota bacterium]